MDNIFSDFSAATPEELVETLAANRHVRIERIISHGHASPKGFWYDQEQDEWVMVLKGCR